MTYCVAITVDDGLVFGSDSRTNAGVDQISTYSKMHRFFGDGDRMITVLTAGNLATSQMVIRQIRRDLETGAATNLGSMQHMAEAADYIGAVSLEVQGRHRTAAAEPFDPGASFIVGGQITGRPPKIYLVYPEGNHIRASTRTPYLQIGELKYGKPILDRIIRSDLDLETAARCALVSMDSTLRSNASVGPPIELQVYRADRLDGGEHMVFEEGEAYLQELREAWQSGLKKAFDGLPRLPKPGRQSPIRVVDGPAD